jgi:glucosamine--fructose-6-phosphate aminotransferase (isomerizing)
MGSKGELTYREILSQPDVWLETLAVLRDQANTVRPFFAMGNYDAVLFAGCGSTYYLSLSAASTPQALAGVPSRGLLSSEVWLYPDSAYADTRRTLLIAVSRSGETTETLRVCEAAFRRHGKGEILTLSCYPDRTLTEVGDMNLIFSAAQEDSIAQTCAFSSLYLACVALAALWSGREDLFASLAQLPGIARRLVEKHPPLAQRLGQTIAWIVSTSSARDRATA